MKIDGELYPFESNFHEVPGGRLHYLDEGEGPVVVMVHGNPTWSFYFRNLVQALRGEYRCIVPDHIGCGLSDKPDDSGYAYTLESRIDDLERLIDEVAPEGPVCLVLHDWGGAIGMGWAARHPDRVRRLVLLNTGAFRNPHQRSIPPALWLIRNTVVGSLLVRGFNAFSFGAVHIASKKGLSPQVRAAYTAPYDNWHNRIATLRFVQDIPLGPKDQAYDALCRTEEGLAQFKDTPALICWGAQDFVFNDAFLEEWQTRLPSAEVHRFEDAGHYILEDKSEEVIERVSGFLAPERAETE